jgi:hypothetical protein
MAKIYLSDGKMYLAKIFSLREDLGTGVRNINSRIVAKVTKNDSNLILKELGTLK